MGIPKYDIFAGHNYRDASWVEAVEGMGAASERMKQIASESPGAYFLFSSQARNVLASIDTTQGLRALRSMGKLRKSA